MGRSRVSGIFGALSVLVLAVAAMGFGLIGAAAQGAGSPWQFSNCPNFEDFTQYVSGHPSIQYIGTGPCTIAIGHPITIPNDVPVSIDGGPAGLILDGANGVGSSFGVVQNSTFTIDHVTLQNNSLVAIDAQAGSNVTILNSTIVNNGTGAKGANGNVLGGPGMGGNSGGAGIIFGGASLTISNSTISNNGTGGNAGNGASGVDGGSGGSGGPGGSGGTGITFSGTSLTVINSTFSNNGTGGNGGVGSDGSNGLNGSNGGNGGNGGDGGAGGSGILFEGTNATLTITGSTLNYNGSGGHGAAAGYGGNGSAPSGAGGNGGNGGNSGDGGNGINATNAIGSTISITNSTISNNGNTWQGGSAGSAGGGYGSANGGNGGNGGSGGSGVLIGAQSATITSSTIYNNGYGSGGGGGGGGAGAGASGAGGGGGDSSPGVNSVAGTTMLTASLLVDNALNCGGTITDGGYNRSVNFSNQYFTDDTCGYAANHSATSSNVLDADFTLANNGNLGNYGGPTETIALSPASTQALDQIPASDGTCSAGAQTDQRGVSRPQGSGCDIGAFELTTSLVPLACQITPATPSYVNPNTSQAWYGKNVTASCPVIDDAAALYGPVITLHTNIDSGATNAQAPLVATSCSGQNCDAVTISESGTVCLATDTTDCATFPTFAIDREAPAVSFATNGATYPVGQPITLQCADPDGGSGIASCSATVAPPNGQPQRTVNGSGNTFTPTQLGTYSYSASATDNVGNQATSISGSFTVGYQLTPLPGNTTTVNRGYWAVIRFAPLDGNGHDLASRTLKVTSVELDGPNNQKIPFAHQFQFGQFGGTAGYQLMVNTRNLNPGDWSLVVQIGSGPTVTTQTIPFTVR